MQSSTTRCAAPSSPPSSRAFATTPYREADHYRLIAGWWQDVDFLPPECLPDTGVVALNEAGAPVAASFVYLPNAKIAYVAWTSIDPALPRRDAIAALRTVLEAVTAIGREFLNGEGFVEIVTHHPATPRLAIKEMGFQDGGAVFTCFKAVGPDVDGRMLIPY